MSQQPVERELPESVPLFPLPNVVLFPNAVLPLHIFEDRYRKMTADVVSSHRQVAMALLKPGWEKDYYGRPAIEPVVCVGTILSHERLADGRYNFLLRGHMRARVVEEMDDEPYRQAVLEPVREKHADEGQLEGLRQILVGLFRSEAYGGLPIGRQIRQMLGAEIATPVIADLLAFHVLPDEGIGLKQALLAETNVKARVERIVEAVAALRPAWQNRPPVTGLN